VKQTESDDPPRRPRSAVPPEPRARSHERTRFADVLEDAADVLERHGELPDAVRWLRKEARAWRR